MILYELTGNEGHPVYQKLQIDNLARQYSFLKSIVEASIGVKRPMLSIEVVKALNYHAITCLHISPGEFRPCAVTVGPYTPPPHFQVTALMQMFTNEVNRFWEDRDPLALAAFVLWKLNHIHPFINGNGRTARVTAYYVLCMRAGGWLPGAKLLPERIVERRGDYVLALRSADSGDLTVLHALLTELMDAQLTEAAAAAAAAAAAVAGASSLPAPPRP